ncbi:tyrosine--tRNA ligase [Abditibacteriota bacterium]|nr:tyrosine--tRNA ligase [Abditibacteriota bacterium]
MNPDSVSLDEALSLLERGADTIISREELRAKLTKSAQKGQPLRVKLGIDPTAPDIHLGFAVVLRKLRQFQDLGHEAHLIIGDFTAQIGDPSGKSKTRPPLSHEEVRQNAQTYQTQLFKILDESKTVLHFNGDWLGAMNFVDVIRLASKSTVAQMLEREDFARRYENKQPISLHEFMYPLCQGQDSVEIRADVELGGTDQRFNNLVGRELQRENGLEPQVVLLMPILVGLDGAQKMSKSLGNYVGISDAPADQFGKLMSLPDEAMRTYFTLCTLVPLEEVESILAGHPMDAKKRLGREIVAIYYGEEAAQEAQKTFESLSQNNEVPTDMPIVKLAGGEIGVLDLVKACFEVSGKEARRRVAQGAVSVNGQKIEDENATFTLQSGLTVKAGKRAWAKVEVA